ncbi:glycosyltransferase family 4 protein [Paenibacillus sp. LHD-117]|uniref:glycosyltransferase family 4 protein n=1 Tax=Paenibacillus sp. LHD-117 TaxID=3071412 RepID=UPI0027E125AF|nr:glycosyltransferase family 4 protein [Paenibacillus sp. LHD-117]MDQ6418339.1 glycosyltransferase family 4 protein [Paenibacillus sp. LHD-117]
MKVLHLPYGIGISALSRALRGQGVDAASLSLLNHHYSYLADIRMHADNVPLDKANRMLKHFFEEALDRFDIFHFHFGETFFPDKRDLKLIADRGKKMAMFHRGSEARILSIARSSGNPYVRVKKTWPEARIRSNLKLLSSYIDHACVPDHELLPYVKPYYKHVHVVPYAIDSANYMPKYPAPCSEPLIVHAPSRQDLKGTKYVLDAVARLKKEGHRFVFKLVERMPHDEALRLYREASIVVDQLLIGSYANLSMEAMAMGKPVICYIREDLLRTFPPDLPIVNANPVTVYDAIKDLLTHPERWASLGEQGRRYVERNHGLEKAAKSLIRVYQLL